jgi:hypothetical protein
MDKGLSADVKNFPIFAKISNAYVARLYRNIRRNGTTYFLPRMYFRICWLHFSCTHFGGGKIFFTQLIALRGFLGLFYCTSTTVSQETNICSTIRSSSDLVTPWNRVFLENLAGQQSSNWPHFMESQCSLPYWDWYWGKYLNSSVKKK